MNNRYIYLNFLSFNSINIGRMLTYFGLCCGHAPYTAMQFFSSRAQGGYTVSNQYKLVDQVYGDAVTIVLFKENIQTIEDHLMYGFYNNLYDSRTMADFKKYWNVALINGIIPGLETYINNYYDSVVNYFKNHDNFFVVDLTSYEAHFNQFIMSTDFAAMVNYLNLIHHTDTDRLIGKIQGRVLQNKPFPYMDYLDHQATVPAIPTGYPVNAYLGGTSNSMPINPGNRTYIDCFVDELTPHIIQP